MPRGRPRKIRVTQEEVIEIREKQKIERSISSYSRKKVIKPGPWTNMDSPIKVKVTLKINKGIMEKEAYGSYPDSKFHTNIEKGWYPILINIVTKSMKRDVEKHGIDNFLAACEKSLNEQKKYGTVILLKASVDHSSNDDNEQRFISCLAKTNKKSISGFLAVRKKIFTVLP